MKITVYTIKDCAFSKQEKEYLNTNKLVFEEKDLETNKDFLTEMLAISNNFAGTPVTRVEKDDGTIAVLKGFTKSEFDTTFGFASPELKAEAGPTVPPVTEVPPVPPVSEVSPVSQPESVTPAPIVTPVETPIVTSPDPLKSVMDDLQAKVDSTLPDAISSEQPPISTSPVVESTNPPVPSAPVDVPVAPAIPSADNPTIPDFPAK